MAESRLTEPEQRILDNTVALWNSFIEYGGVHSDDVNDFRFHIHALQNIILSWPEVKAQLDNKGQTMTQIK